MRWTLGLNWFVGVALTMALPVAAQPAPASGVSTPQEGVSTPQAIEALRSRLRALDDERARVAQELAELESRAQAPAAAPTSPTTPTSPTEPAFDAVSSVDDIRYLETVVVSGTRREAELGNVPAAVTLVGQETIQPMQRGSNLEESLRRVPGALLRDQLGGSSRVTISIRGAGATAADGARGVRLFVDGIPKNNAGGSAQDFINIDLSAAESIEVLRGPSSALYGNQAGGVVSITSESGGPRAAFTVSQVLGSYGFARTHVGGGGQASAGRFNYFGTAFNTALDGFRENSSQDNTGFTGKLGMTFDDRSTLSVVTGYDHSRQRLPGALTAAEMAANPRQANPVATALGGTSLALDEFRFGGTYRRDFTAAQIEATGYYTPRGVGYFFLETLRLNQHFVNRGASGRVIAPTLFGTPARLTTGVDYQNTPITTGTFGRANTILAGQTLSEVEESATTVGPFALVDVALGDRVSATAGVRYDHITFSTENLIRPQVARADIVYEQFSPRLGLTFRLAEDVALYASYNEGFEAPVLDQLRNSPAPDGEFVPNHTVKPFDVRAFEVGARGQIGRRVTFEASAYRQRTNDLIVSQSFLRPPPLPGQFSAVVNAGKVDQSGLELGATVRLLTGLQVTGSYTYSDFTYRDYVSSGQDFSGRTVPGVPAHNVFAEMSYRTARGLTTAFDIQRVGRFFLNDPNTASNDPYVVASLRVGYDLRLRRGFELSPWVGLMNLRDEVYVSQTQPNAAAGRYFNPLPGLTFLAGVKFGY
jgi:iron complex outermembrane receptor protein